MKYKRIIDLRVVVGSDEVNGSRKKNGK